MNKEYKHLLKQKKRKHQNYKMEELANSSEPTKILVNTQELFDKKGGVQIYKNCLFQSANYILTFRTCIQNQIVVNTLRFREIP